MPMTNVVQFAKQVGAWADEASRWNLEVLRWTWETGVWLPLLLVAVAGLFLYVGLRRKRRHWHRHDYLRGRHYGGGAGFFRW